MFEFICIVDSVRGEFVEGFHIMSLMRRLIEYGFSYPRTRYFSLRGQRKVSKRNPPDTACFLRFSHLPHVAGRDSLSLPATCGIPAAPLRASPDNCSDARRGIRDVFYHSIFCTYVTKYSCFESVCVIVNIINARYRHFFFILAIKQAENKL